MSTPSPEPRVLIVGFDPYRMPTQTDPEAVMRLIESGVERYAAHGITAVTGLLGQQLGAEVDAELGAALRAHPFECVTLGGGLWRSREQVDLLEQVVNLIRVNAPQAAIAFNSTPVNSYDAAVRWLS